MSLVCPLTCITASTGRIYKQGEFVEKYFYVGAYNVTGLALLYEKAIYFCSLTPFGKLVFTVMITSEGCTGFRDRIGLSWPSSIPGMRKSWIGEGSFFCVVGEASSEWYPELLPWVRGSTS